MKKLLLSIIFLVLLCSQVQIGSATGQYFNEDLFYGKLLASGYSSSDAQDLVAKAKAGEPLTPFHEADYDIYTTSAEENGLLGDMLLIRGVISEYSYLDGSSSFILVEENGNKWHVVCGQLVGEINVGDDIFIGYENQTVELYCSYLGVTGIYDLPSVDIITYGGMFVPESKTFLMTLTAKHEMDDDNLYALNTLIGAEKLIMSYEPRNMR